MYIFSRRRLKLTYYSLQFPPSLASLSATKFLLQIYICSSLWTVTPKISQILQNAVSSLVSVMPCVNLPISVAKAYGIFPLGHNRAISLIIARFSKSLRLSAYLKALVNILRCPPVSIMSPWKKCVLGFSSATSGKGHYVYILHENMFGNTTFPLDII